MLVVHGGAQEIPEGAGQDYEQGCRRAARAGWAVLERGGSALDAVEATVRLMEDDATFDAGRGSYLNADGEVELDAIVMVGRDLNVGAVAAVHQICHPVTLARLVMSESDHALLVGPGALAFARERGMSTAPPDGLVVEREIERWRKLHAEPSPAPPSGGTVGGVALDVQGDLAAATSTGGTMNKLPGRVGDSPLVGCGAYADNRSAAASATGDGEALMRIVISKAACDAVEDGRSPQEAADAVIATLAERTDGQGGIIVLEPPLT
jgi:beta-aspartyl-peptidase (threonine type)